MNPSPCRGCQQKSSFIAKIAWAVGIVLTGTSCVHEMKKSELQNEIQAHATETINNVWYVGSTDTHDLFIHNAAMRSRKLRVAKGDVSIPNRFPATKDRDKWLLMKSDTDMGLKGNPIDSLPPGVKLQVEE